MAALQAALLLRLPGGRADIVTAQGIGVQIIQLLLTLFGRCGPELFTALLLLRRRMLNLRFDRFPMLLLYGAIFYRRRGVIAAIVIALGHLMELLRRGLALGIAGRRVIKRVIRRPGTLLSWPPDAARCDRRADVGSR